ncbi:MAG: NINE protein [Burkholderiaceae bacterium]
MKNKTLATWLALLGGPLGLHRFYLHGWGDRIGWLLPWPSLVGAMGVVRARQLGVDDQLSWVLAPLLGFTIAACCLTAIIYGLTEATKWNQRFNPSAQPPTTAGNSNGLTVLALVCAMLLGTTALMASLAYSFQHVFEYQALQ